MAAAAGHAAGHRVDGGAGVPLLLSLRGPRGRSAGASSDIGVDGAILGGGGGGGVGKVPHGIGANQEHPQKFIV